LYPSTAANRVCLAKEKLFIDRQSCEETVITAGADARANYNGKVVMIAGRFGHHRQHPLERDILSPYCLPYTTEKIWKKGCTKALPSSSLMPHVKAFTVVQCT